MVAAAEDAGVVECESVERGIGVESGGEAGDEAASGVDVLERRRGDEVAADPKVPPCSSGAG